MTKACLVYKALERCGDFCAVHAGAVLPPGGDSCVLLPGASGSGKSTLVAGLAGAGFDVFSDDTTVLSDHSLWVRPLPCSIALKSGSWSVLAAVFPALDDVPVHCRPDGKRVRYLPAHLVSMPPPGKRRPVGWVVFPRYAPEARTTMTKLESLNAFRRLLPALLPLRGRLTAAEVGQLIGWIGDSPCYEMPSSNLKEAMALIDRLCR
jgi:hypothetical protein